MGPFHELLKNGISWEIELTSRCNSRCVGCSRYSEYYYPNPYFDPKHDLDPKVLKKALAETPHIEFILFCGNYGDPLLHPEIFEILEHIQSKHGSLRRMAHTNGSFGRKDFWQRLAGYFKSPGSYVKFSIDGLQVSHEKFRRGTHWQQVLENAETFIQAGGRAVWKMIEFDHNRDEIPMAQDLSEKMGFKKFELRKNNYPGLDQPILQDADWKNPPASVSLGDRSPEELETWYQSQIREKKSDQVQCRSLEKKNIYLDVYGKVWPCCWVGGLPFRPEHELRGNFKNKVLDRYETHFNSLKNQKLDDVLTHPWWSQDLPASWEFSKNKPHRDLLSTCAKTCGKCTP